MSFGQVLFGFSGRINRAKYWLAAVFWTVVFILLVGIILVIIGRGSSDFSGDDIGAVIASLGLGILLFVVVLIPMLVSWLAVGIKRLHDRDRSGWWIVLFYFVPAVLDGIGRSSQSDIIALVLSLAGFGIAIWGLVELGFLRGTVGPNRYGPDPLSVEPVPATR
jgi:uncharacterized membrane protein YhaH (DUF805 family)